MSGCADIFFFHGAFLLIGHFTVMDGSEAEGDLVLIQTFLLYYVNQVQGSKFKFEFGSTCATRCKFLGALPKF